MRTKSVLAASLLTLAGVATHSSAAAPICNLVVDPPGDVNNTIQGPAAFPEDGGLDLLGGDVASNAKSITAVIRVASDPGTSPLYAKRFIVDFAVAGLKNRPALAVAFTPQGTTYSGGYWGETASSTGGPGYVYPAAITATGKVVGKEIFITVPLEQFAGVPEIGAIKKGAKISNIKVSSNRRVPVVLQVTGQLFTADEATGKKTYAAGAKSCVTIG